MSLNKIQIPPYLVSQLYKTHLIEPISSNNTKSINSEKLKSLGENKKQILILVNNSDVVFLNDNQLNFLTQLLTACKLNLGDVAIINFYGLNMNHENLFIQFNSKVVLLFDVAPVLLEFPISFPNFTVQQHKETQFLFMPSLQEIEADKSLKLKTWNCLKIIFKL